MWKGLTWDHPRGFNALDAASRDTDVAGHGLVAWDVQPLEGFESAPIAELCARYDLVVLDHPHVGEAVEAGCLHSIEDILGHDLITMLEAASIGPSLSSYRFAGKHWALPLDAATQVMAVRPDLTASIPVKWEDVVAFVEAGVPVAASIAGPHAALSFFSVCAALGEPPAVADPETLVSADIGKKAHAILSRIVRSMPEQAKPLNPIGLLDLMGREDSIALCPLVYGYVNYSRPADGRKPLRFHNAPRVAGGHPVGTLGGTGIGFSKRSAPDSALKAHVLWLMGKQAQCGFIPAHDGQPSRREAWFDAEVNAAWGDFYVNTADTLEHSYVRPRHSGYIAFQTAASAALRESFETDGPADEVLESLQDLYTKSRNGGER
ncbi:carbohydrate ABC transporter substrate-binding protein [Hoeflea sp.]|uniref:carbohydrate ABC transporter substrate-binding protein n=1 Tax=Hoeflea sp. TaxID=1940281 RepID=UPI003B51DB04